MMSKSRKGGTVMNPENEQRKARVQRFQMALGYAIVAASVLLGDRNFGIFSVAYHAHTHGHGVVIRLTGVRARKIAWAVCSRNPRA